MVQDLFHVQIKMLEASCSGVLGKILIYYLFSRLRDQKINQCHGTLCTLVNGASVYTGCCCSLYTAVDSWQPCMMLFRKNMEKFVVCLTLPEQFDTLFHTSVNCEFLKHINICHCYTSVDCRN